MKKHSFASQQFSKLYYCDITDKADLIVLVQINAYLHCIGFLNNTMTLYLKLRQITQITHNNKNLEWWSQTNITIVTQLYNFYLLWQQQLIHYICFDFVRFPPVNSSYLSLFLAYHFMKNFIWVSDRTFIFLRIPYPVILNRRPFLWLS